MIDEFQIKAKKDTYVIQDLSEINDVIREATGDVTYDQVSIFMKMLKSNIEKQLDSISLGAGGGIMEEIKKSISKPVVKYEGAKLKAFLSIKHPLAIAINDGTGIYGPERTPITPKNRKAMFIPLTKLRYHYKNLIMSTNKKTNNKVSNKEFSPHYSIGKTYTT